MDEKRARAMLPVWADGDDWVQEYKPKHNTDGETYKRIRMTENPEKAIRSSKSRWGELWHTAMAVYYALLRKYLIAFILLAAFILEGIVVSTVTERKVSKEVRQEVESEMRQGFTVYLEQQEEKQKAQSFLTGEASLEAAIADLAIPLGEHAAGLGMDRHVTYEGIMTYLWVDCARLASKFRGKNDIKSVLTDPQQIEHYTEGHATTSEYREMGEEVARAYLTGNWPDGFSPELVYANINTNGTVTARNDFQTGSTTVTWSYKRGK